MTPCSGLPPTRPEQTTKEGETLAGASARHLWFGARAALKSGLKPFIKGQDWTVGQQKLEGEQLFQLEQLKED